MPRISKSTLIPESRLRAYLKDTLNDLPNTLPEYDEPRFLGKIPSPSAIPPSPIDNALQMTSPSSSAALSSSTPSLRASPHHPPLQNHTAHQHRYLFPTKVLSTTAPSSTSPVLKFASAGPTIAGLLSWPTTIMYCSRDDR
jgi:hypothetical protein